MFKKAVHLNEADVLNGTGYGTLEGYSLNIIF